MSNKIHNFVGQRISPCTLLIFGYETHRILESGIGKLFMAQRNHLNRTDLGIVRPFGWLWPAHVHVLGGSSLQTTPTKPHSVEKYPWSVRGYSCIREQSCSQHPETCLPLYKKSLLLSIHWTSIWGLGLLYVSPRIIVSLFVRLVYYFNKLA